MGHIRIHFLLCITFLLVIFTCGEAETISSTESQTIQNLRAFAKLYGYVKYFHPSDEASAIDWDKFAIYGAKRVKDAKDTEQLKTALEGLFLPIAPTIQIYTSDQKPEDPMKPVPDDTTGLKIVAWQHIGVRLYGPSIYKSIRLNRKNRLPRGGPSCTVFQCISSANVSEHRGKEIKLRVFVRTDLNGSGNWGELCIGFYKGTAETRGFDMEERFIKGKQWKAYEIVGKVPDDATQITVGFEVRGTGQVWLDACELLVMTENNKWQTIQIENPGFEEADENNKLAMWKVYAVGTTCEISAEGPYKGDKCLLIQNLLGKLFEEYPKIGEVVNKPLDSGLFCQIPLALYSDENGTLGKNERYPFAELAQKLDDMSIDELTGNDEYLRLGGMVIAWNVFQHFYPYFDVVNVDWDSELTNALQRAMTDKNEEDFYYTLCRFTTKLQDGHAWVGHPRAQGPWMYLPLGVEGACLPFGVDWIENQVVVTVSKDPTKVQKGDIIVSIDGIRAEQVLLDAEAYVSGSPQLRRFVAAVFRFTYGIKDTKAKLVVERDDQAFEIEVERNHRGRISEPRRPKIDKIQDDIFYVDLRRAKMTDIKERINDLANAKGVIFDLRGYPKGYHDVICHLLREKDTSDAWIRVPQIIYPDLQNIVGYRKSGSGWEAKEPRIKGKVVFLTNAIAISAAETHLSFVEHFKLGEIVGQPTAGANGMANKFTLPGGYSVSWAGMEVVKHDGSQHHLIGIQPTVPVQRTIQGVIEGRDEFLEKALEIINKE